MKELFQIQPDPEPFDFELAECIVNGLHNQGEEEDDRFYTDAARLLRDAIERLRTNT